MADQFIGRAAELKMLAAAQKSSRLEFIPVYGRRRVGKSELILKFMAQCRPGLYYLGKQAPPGLQIREFLEEAARVFNQPLLAEAAVGDWHKALDLVLRQRDPGQKFVLAFDEFQWMAKASPELPSVLQGLCDQESRGNSNLMLILCGSYMGFMEKEVLGKKSPLFGRRTAQILLPPFNYLEAGRFHPRWSPADRAMIYFICGGIPYYLRFIDEHDSVPTGIRKNFLTEYSALFREADFLLREELTEVRQYHGILMALAAEASSPAAISRATGVPERSLYYYLQHLIALGYVARRYPLAVRKPTRTSVRFAIDDPLLKFWFRFVYPNMSFIQQMGAEAAYSHLIARHLPAYFGLCFERLCREALPNIYRREDVRAEFKIGQYWDKQRQIDLVGIRGDNRIDLGECKWGAVKSAGALEREVADKFAGYPNPKNYSIQPRIFCQTKPRSAVADHIRWHTLDDIYADGCND